MSIKDFISLYVSDTYLEKQFRATTTALKGFLEIKSVYSAIEFLSKKKRFRKDIFPENSEDIFKKNPPFALLGEFASDYGNDFRGFVLKMHEVKLNAEKLNCIRKDEYVYPVDAINIMTATRSKGREFDCVVILDAIEQLWPCPNPNEEPINEEEERRLFYVALTRTKKELYITVPEYYGNQTTTPSKYISELGV